MAQVLGPRCHVMLACVHPSSLSYHLTYALIIMMRALQGWRSPSNQKWGDALSLTRSCPWSRCSRITSCSCLSFSYVTLRGEPVTRIITQLYGGFLLLLFCFFFQRWSQGNEEAGKRRQDWKDEKPIQERIMRKATVISSSSRLPGLLEMERMPPELSRATLHLTEPLCILPFEAACMHRLKETRSY